MSGVDVPRLGSVKDKILRKYLLKRIEKDLVLHKLVANIAMATGDSKDWVRMVTNTWNKYVTLAYFMEGEEESKEVDMKKEYEYWRKLKPKMKSTKEGLIVSGIPEEHLQSKVKPSNN